jgi:hypothetical protein
MLEIGESFRALVPPFQNGEIFGRFQPGLRALRFTPGCHIAGFQPVPQEQGAPMRPGR